MSLSKVINKIDVHPSESWDPLQLLTPFGFNSGSGPRIKSGVGLLIFAFALILLPASFAQAKTVTFQTKTWELPTLQAKLVDQTFARNDFSLSDVMAAAIFGSASTQPTWLLDDGTVSQIAEIQKQVDQKARDAVLEIKNNFATTFDPGQSGQVVDLYLLRWRLASDMASLTLPVIISEPNNVLAQTNTLGINELVAAGESNFTGSPNNRIHNINFGATKVHGRIVFPRHELSFIK